LLPAKNSSSGPKFTAMLLVVDSFGRAAVMALPLTLFAACVTPARQAGVTKPERAIKRIAWSNR